jgi:hypothetical protein
MTLGNMRELGVQRLLVKLYLDFDIPVCDSAA